MKLVKNSALFLVVAPFSVIFSTLFAMSLQLIIDGGLGGDVSVFLKYSVEGVVFCGLDIVFCYWLDILEVKIKNQYTKNLRVKYYEKIFQQDTSEFLRGETSSDFSKLTVDAEVITEKYCGSILDIYKNIWSLVISVIAIIYAQWELAIFVLIFSVISVNLPNLFQTKADQAEKDFLEANNRHLNHVQECLNNFFVIRVHGIYKSQREKYNEIVKAVEQTDNNRNKNRIFLSFIAMGISELSFILIIIFAMFLVISGKLTVGYITSVSQLLGGIMSPLEQLPGNILSLKSGKSIITANEKEMGVSDSQNRTLEIEKMDNMMLSNVFYTGENNKLILSDINICLNPGEKYALVGASGAGKSTLAKAIAGIISPSNGEVYINDQDIHLYQEENLYRHLVYQSQKVTLFQDTIKNNIILGKSYDEDRFGQVIDIACLQNVLSHVEEKENALVSEAGKNFSGGEVQRIALARCLYAEPQFLILDEIAASLDNYLAMKVESNVLNLQNMGLLMVTHHLYPENMSRYDEILVMKNGEIVERGTWQNLMNQKGELFRLAVLDQENRKYV